MAAGRPARTKEKNKKGAIAEKSPPNGALKFAPTLWAAADKLRGNMDAAEYKHVALGLIFLKYISDRFDERRAEILADEDAAKPLREELAEDIDAYRAENVFWVPKTARWTFLKENATSVEPTGLGGDFSFVRWLGQLQRFQPLPLALVGTSRARLGVIEPYGSTTQIPLYERLYAGGANSVRGYGRRLVGPPTRLSAVRVRAAAPDTRGRRNAGRRRHGREPPRPEGLRQGTAPRPGALQPRLHGLALWPQVGRPGRPGSLPVRHAAVGATRPGGPVPLRRGEPTPPPPAPDPGPASLPLVAAAVAPLRAGSPATASRRPLSDR